MLRVIGVLATEDGLAHVKADKSVQVNTSLLFKLLEENPGELVPTLRPFTNH